MSIESRLGRIERTLGMDAHEDKPFVLVVSAGPHEDNRDYEARLRRRIKKAVRRRPNETFIMLL